jgi:hypothetical protein
MTARLGPLNQASSFGGQRGVVGSRTQRCGRMVERSWQQPLRFVLLVVLAKVSDEHPPAKHAPAQADEQIQGDSREKQPDVCAEPAPQAVLTKARQANRIPLTGKEPDAAKKCEDAEAGSDRTAVLDKKTRSALTGR